MIGHIQGEVLFSDGSELILLTASGIGYQVYYHGVVPEGTRIAIYTGHVIRESSQELFGFRTLKEKKLFELLNTVKGIGPKSAFALLSSLAPNDICQAISLDQKKVLSSAPGIGPKAAAQIVLDLQNKIHRVMMFGDSYVVEKVIMPASEQTVVSTTPTHSLMMAAQAGQSSILNDAIMACKELGFKEEKIIPLAQRIMNEVEVTRAEQLVHLVLKEI